MEIGNLLVDILQAITTAQAITQELEEMFLSGRNIQACMAAWGGVAMMMLVGIGMEGTGMEANQILCQVAGEAGPQKVLLMISGKDL